MLPALVLVGFGRRRRIWLPMPAFLLWPFWLLGWLVWLVFRIFQLPWAQTLRQALLLGAHLSGVQLGIDSADGNRIYIRMI
jgi:hypothetical protein